MSAANDPSDAKAEARREAAAERAKAAARESAHWLREEAQRLYTGYQKQSKYFKWRSWIVAVYVVITLSSIALATRSEWTNQIHAYVKTDHDYDHRLVVAVQNDSPEEWTHVDLVLDGRWHFSQASLPPHEWITKNVTEFVRRGGDHARGDYRGQTLVVKTDQGDFEQSLASDAVQP